MLHIKRMVILLDVGVCLLKLNLNLSFICLHRVKYLRYLKMVIIIGVLMVVGCQILLIKK